MYTKCTIRWKWDGQNALYDGNGMDKMHYTMDYRTLGDSSIIFNEKAILYNMVDHNIIINILNGNSSFVRANSLIKLVILYCTIGVIVMMVTGHVCKKVLGNRDMLSLAFSCSYVSKYVAMNRQLMQGRGYILTKIGAGHRTSPCRGSGWYPSGNKLPDTHIENGTPTSQLCYFMYQANGKEEPVQLQTTVFS